ncbi:general transcription factor 3C polypeptide 2-like [Micropterus dolomieu]|uniref:general transcription factor 3C polypeptide 2-like n=1 Tax=Micropterus dolomieu TaxID=147949 RepID=UPI001E8DE892|nr:general transcription factor 3C polypeptide 2-like [Micropterus dolomieu]
MDTSLFYSVELSKLLLFSLRYLLATAGDDRYVKTWDLRRLYDPINVLKRCLTTDVHWPLNAPGILLAQENAFAANGSHGVHYFDHFMRSNFPVPRTGTVWSMSYTDWLNCVVTSDSLGDVILAILPHISSTPQHVKRTIERRFPIYLTSLVPHDAAKEKNQEMGGVEEEGDAVEEQGGDSEGPDAGSEGGNENDKENRGDGGRHGKDKCPPLRFQKYKDAAKKYYLHHTDGNMLTFIASEKQPLWKRMKETELKAKINMDEMPLAALHKVCFNPNMCCHTWVASAGQTGLVRLNCVRGLITSEAKQMISENQAQFNALYSQKDSQKEAVQTVTDEL